MLFIIIELTKLGEFDRLDSEYLLPWNELNSSKHIAFNQYVVSSSSSLSSIVLFHPLMNSPCGSSCGLPKITLHKTKSDIWCIYVLVYFFSLLLQISYKDWLPSSSACPSSPTWEDPVRPTTTSDTPSTPSTLPTLTPPAPTSPSSSAPRPHSNPSARTDSAGRSSIPPTTTPGARSRPATAQWPINKMPRPSSTASSFLTPSFASKWL